MQISATTTRIVTLNAMDTTEISSWNSPLSVTVVVFVGNVSVVVPMFVVVLVVVVIVLLFAPGLNPFGKWSILPAGPGI